MTEESTSAARQREIVEMWAKANDHEIVGWAEDIDVSGSVDPFDTPQLGPWLARPDDWDILCAWKLDRLGRRAIPLNKLFGWVMDNEKVIVCVSDNIDLSTWVGRLVANVLAGVAEGELEAIRERTKASRKKLLEDGRWPGGPVPFGFEPYTIPGGGWKLKLHREQSQTVRRMAAQVIDGASITAVAAEHGITAPGVWNMLTSPLLLGHATLRGKTVRDRTGQPVFNAEPLLTEDEMNRLQKALSVRRQSQRRTVGVSVLYGVAFCPLCDRQLYHRRNASHRYYYCQNGHGRNIPAGKLEKWVFDTFLEQFGDDKVKEKSYIPAEDHQNELEAAKRAVEELSTLVGTMSSDTVRSILTEQMSALDFEIQRLEKLPNQPAGWEYTETDKTFKQAWETASDEDKRRMIIDKQISARVIKEGNDLHFYIETQKSPPK